jgi:hypothetical protein
MACHKPLLRALIASACAATAGAGAVYLSHDGVGQALVYPYYTVQSVDGNTFNTYISLRNQAADAKIARVRFREGRNSREVLRFDVYLAPNDMWTATLVPASADAASPARIISRDVSCTNPPFPAEGVDFRNFVYAFPDDGAGTGLDRTREGFLEVIEMATLTGASAASVAHGASGVPVNCAAVQGQSPAPALALGAPSGGLSGTLTLINVMNGMDFTLDAEALAELSTRSLYRALEVSQPVDFNSPEIDPVSHVIANGSYYRSVWSRPIDAVSAVFMRSAWRSEYVLDAATRSRTDIVTLFPTRQHYVTATDATAPFTARFAWFPACNGASAGEPVIVSVFNRESRGGPAFPIECGFLCPPGLPVPSICGAAPVASVGASGALGSTNRGFGGASLLPLAIGENGWIEIRAAANAPLTSLASSTRTNLATGAVTSGSHSFSGLPVTGLWVRTFENGSLACSAGTCQGNYGGSFPLTYRRSITPAD